MQDSKLLVFVSPRTCPILENIWTSWGKWCKWLWDQDITLPRAAFWLPTNWNVEFASDTDDLQGVEGRVEFPLIYPFYFPWSVKKYSIQYFFLPLACFFWKTPFASWNEHCTVRRRKSPALSGQIIPAYHNQQIVSTGLEGVHFCSWLLWKGSWVSGGRKVFSLVLWKY